MQNSSVLKTEPALGPSSWRGERKTYLESKARIGANFKNYKSSPEGAPSGSWLQDRRLKSPVLQLAFVDILLFCLFYWIITYFLFHRISALLGVMKGGTACISIYLLFLAALLSTNMLYLLPTVWTLLWGQKAHHFPLYLWVESVVLFFFY